VAIEIIHGSALDLGPDMLETADVQIIDPPYSDHVHANCASHRTGGKGSVPRDLGFEALTPALREHVAMAAACVKRWSVIFSDFEGAHEWRASATNWGAEYIRLVPWVRWSQPQLSGDRPPTGAEAVNIFHAQKVGARGGRSPLAKHWNGPGSLTHFERRCMRGQDKHPTEKPLDLMLDLVSWFSDPGETVLDLCAGAGTTAQACRLLGRDCIAVEQDERWARIATARVQEPLSPRDRTRAQEWCVSISEEASTVREPRDETEVRTWERAQRRIADAARVAVWV
jgi:hypothetical protein